MKYLLLLFFCITFSIHATPLSPQHLPSDLLFLGKPIDAYCFSDSNNTVNTIQLKNCGAIHAKFSVKNEKNEFLTKKDFIGYDWIEAEYHANGYTYYQAFPTDQKQFWIYSINNGGGTGSFTEISLFKRVDNDAFELTPLTGGDRCNGGIVDVQDKNSKLTYAVNLTASDVISFIKENPKIKPYDNLASCAICCFAKAIYEVDSSLHAKLQYVDFGNTTNPAELPTQGSYQTCFNKLFAAYVAKGKNKLNIEELTQFTNEFNEKCVK